MQSCRVIMYLISQVGKAGAEAYSSWDWNAVGTVSGHGLEEHEGKTRIKGKTPVVQDQTGGRNPNAHTRVGSLVNKRKESQR